VTSWPEIKTQADLANAHPYPKRGAQAREYFKDAIAIEAKNMAGKPVAFTETGYYTLPQSSDWGGVDEQAQARMTLNLFATAAKLGVRRTYLYELLDAYPDPEGKEVANHFGLFALDKRAKPSAVALHNLTAILGEKAEDRRSEASDPLNYTVEGLPATADSLLLRKDSGAQMLILWNEPDVWDEDRLEPIPASLQEVTVDLGATYASVRIFDPIAGSTPIARLSNVRSVVLGLTDHPLILEIDPARPLN
jgi:hypothetical protein